MKAYARQAKDRAFAQDAVEIQKRAEIRVGELMAAQRDIGLLPRGGDRKSKVSREPLVKPPTLKEAGIDKSLANRARALANDY